jgi:hypothetical protein
MLEKSNEGVNELIGTDLAESTEKRRKILLEID